MSVITIAVLIFSFVGAVDYLIGNKLGVGAEFEKAFSLFRPMALTMLGMIVISPAIGVWLTPFFDWFYSVFGVDPSIIPASLFANDMGGMHLSKAICKDPAIGGFNAFIISSMTGCVISFIVPFSLGIVKREQHKDLFFGMLCGIVTVPVGSLAAGLVLKISPLALLIDLLPLILLGLTVGLALVFAPKVCVKCFSVFGTFIKALALIGLVCAVFTFLTKIKISPHFDTFENAALICANACVTFSGALPFMFVASKLLNKPLSRIGAKLGVDSVSALAFLGSLVTNASTFGVMEKMNRKGVVLNAAFAVSASYSFGSHLAFTMAFDQSYVLPMIIGKVISGVSAVLLALLLYKDDAKKV